MSWTHEAKELVDGAPANVKRTSKGEAPLKKPEAVGATAELSN